jgi:hypothetical protein
MSKSSPSTRTPTFSKILHTELDVIATDYSDYINVEAVIDTALAKKDEYFFATIQRLKVTDSIKMNIADSYHRLRDIFTPSKESEKDAGYALKIYSDLRDWFVLHDSPSAKQTVIEAPTINENPANANAPLSLDSYEAKLFEEAALKLFRALGSKHNSSIVINKFKQCTKLTEVLDLTKHINIPLNSRENNNASHDISSALVAFFIHYNSTPHYARTFQHLIDKSLNKLYGFESSPSHAKSVDLRRQRNGSGWRATP